MAGEAFACVEQVRIATQLQMEFKLGHVNRAACTRRRLRRHSLASSVGSGSTSGVGGSLYSTAVHGGSFPRLEAARRAEEARAVTLEDVKGCGKKHK